MNKTLTRADLARCLYQEFNVSKKDAMNFVHDLFEGINLAFIDGQEVKISSFGTFKQHDKKKRVGRNPKTKKEAIISARKVISFRTSIFLKSKVNKALRK
ncbi:MAG: HU family DNA-binding protein [Alphaproteobacteria bacterium GM202ARS2]|nr:HU family DNA-binding protein [Alphaproteobacteria bacterium GM202ARS2]